jgi:hypothetical protein
MTIKNEEDLYNEIRRMKGRHICVDITAIGIAIFFISIISFFLVEEMRYVALCAAIVVCWGTIMLMIETIVPETDVMKCPRCLIKRHELPRLILQYQEDLLRELRKQGPGYWSIQRNELKCSLKYDLKLLETNGLGETPNLYFYKKTKKRLSDVKEKISELKSKDEKKRQELIKNVLYSEEVLRKTLNQQREKEGAEEKSETKKIRGLFWNR